MQSSAPCTVTPPGEVEHLHAAVVRGHQRALGGGQRDDELALRVLAVDEERPGEAERHLGHAVKFSMLPTS
jgi:hypothetical protein